MKAAEAGISPVPKASPKPIITNKLPKAFCTPHVQHSRHPSRNPREALQQEEFHKVNQLLSPIKLTPGQRRIMKSSLTRVESSIFKDVSRNVSFERGGKISLKVVPHSGLHAQDMITLGVVANSAKGGCLKKVLHAPSLRIFAVKEVPIGTREVRQGLYDWVAKWEKVQKRTPQLVRLHTTFWNTPEGCMSFVLDHVRGHSLATLSEQLSCPVPESALAEVTREVLKALQALQSKAECHGGVTPSQILITKEGEVKLSLGLAARASRECKGRSLREDLKDMGFALLQAACGGPEWMESDELSVCLRSTLPAVCRASITLKSFLSALLNSQESTIDSLQTHPWLTQSTYPGPALTLKDLWRLNVYVPVQGSPVTNGPAHKQLERICNALHVLGDGVKRSASNRGCVSELAEELGLEQGYVWDKVSRVL